jgi:hypothetical protein
MNQLARVACLSAILLTTGCTVVNVELEHTSHPFAGEPFYPERPEAALNTANVILRKEYANGVYVEQGLGYKFKTHPDDFVGPKLTYTGRIGITLWSKDHESFGNRR